MHRQIIDFSYTSVVTMIVFTNLMCIGIYLMIRKGNFLSRYGYNTFIILITLVFVRMLFPVELCISTNVNLPANISEVMSEMFNAKVVNYKVDQLLGLAWIVGMMIMLLKFLLEYRSLRKRTVVCGEDITNEDEISKWINCYCKKNKEQLHVYRCGWISTPFIFGIIKKYICIPENVEYQCKELEFVMQHEICHYNNNDLIIKAILLIINCMYWWNPITYSLRREFAAVLEVRVDDKMQLGKDERMEYMSFLLNVYRKGKEQRFIPISEFSDGMKTNMYLRFEYMNEKDEKKAEIQKKLAVLLWGIAFVFSYCIIFEPLYIPDSFIESEDEFMITKDNAYLVCREDGTYDLYVDGDFLMNVTNIDDSFSELDILECGE